MTDDFRFKVRYPHGGTHFLMGWKTHNEGTRVIVARSKQALDHMVTNLLQMHSTSHVDDAVHILWKMEVEIVNLTPELQGVIERLNIKEDKKEFFRTVHYQVQAEFEKTKVLPPGWRQCDCPLGQEHLEDRCAYTEIMTGLNYNEFWDRYHTEHERLFPTSPTVCRGEVSRARPARPDETLWAIHTVTNSWQGLDKTPINEYPVDDPYFWGRVLFLFVVKEELDLSDTVLLFEIATKQAKAELEERRALWHKKLDQEAQEHSQKIAQLFKDSV